MVKLQKILAYKYKTKTGETKNNYKYVLNIPQEIIDELGWNNGNELELLAVKIVLIINNNIYIIIIRIVKISGGYRSVGLITTQKSCFSFFNHFFRNIENKFTRNTMV